MDWLSKAKVYQDEWVSLRRGFHRHPELGNQEYHTKKKIITYLQQLSIETQEILDTGVLGILRCGQPGKTVLLRSDMDALPIQEENTFSYVSEVDGIMHACGHDFHMTCVLGAAKLLSAHREELCGTFLFLFQPDEEGDGGARRMIDAGVLDGVDAVFGCHCDPSLPAGSIGIKYGSFYAASTVFEINVEGVSCHGAEPKKGKDALLASAAFVLQSKTLEDENTIVHTGILKAGRANNVVADHAYLKGMMRTKGLFLRDQKIQQLQRCIKAIETDTGTIFHAHIQKGYPGVTNHDAETDYVKKKAVALLGNEKVIVFTEGTMTTEDFGYYLLAKPGCFYHLGVGSQMPLHHPCFCPDEEALSIGIALHAQILSGYTM